MWTVAGSGVKTVKLQYKLTHTYTPC